MNTQNRHPRWWQLSLLVPLMLELLFIEAKMSVPVWEHQMLELGVILLIFGVLAGWLGANRDALQNKITPAGRRPKLERATGPAPAVYTLARVEQTSVKPHSLADSAAPTAEFQQVSYGPPSGAQLN